MTSRLKEAFEKASRLPQNLQDQIAQGLLDEIECELKGEETFAASEGLLEKLAGKAIEEFEVGKTVQLNGEGHTGGFKRRGSAMLNTLWAVVRKGKIKLLEHAEIPDGTKVLVTLLPEEGEFWAQASQSSLDSVWGNKEDDIYGQLL